MSNAQQGSGTPVTQQQQQGQGQATGPVHPAERKAPQWVGPGPRPEGVHPVLGIK